MRQKGRIGGYDTLAVSVDELGHVGLFKPQEHDPPVPERVIKFLAGSAEFEKRDEASAVYLQDGEIDQFFVLQKGICHVRHRTQDADNTIREMHNSFRCPGEELGLTATLSGGKCTSVAYTYTRCEFLRWDRDAILIAMQLSETIIINMVRGLSNRFRRYAGLQELGQYMTKAQSLAALLLEWKEVVTVHNKLANVSERQACLVATAREIAEWINDKESHVRRLLADFEKEGLISIAKRRGNRDRYEIAIENSSDLKEKYCRTFVFPGGI